MTDEKKKRKRTPGAVRVTLRFSDEERIAIGNGRKVSNADLTNIVQGLVEKAKPGWLRDYYLMRLDALNSGNAQ